MNKIKSLLLALGAPLLYMVCQSAAGLLLVLFAGDGKVKQYLSDPVLLYEFLLSRTTHMLLIGGLFTFAVVLLVVWQSGRSIKATLDFRPCPAGITLSAAGAGAGLNLFTIVLMGLIPIPEQLLKEYEASTKALVNPEYMALTVLSIVLVVPLAEEAVFRGVVFASLRRNFSFLIALILQALVFSIAHFNIIQGAYVLIAGLALGLVFHWTRSLLASTLFHAVYNATSLAFSGGQVSDSVILQLFIFSPILVLVCLRYLYMHRVTEPA